MRIDRIRPHCFSLSLSTVANVDIKDDIDMITGLNTNASFVVQILRLAGLFDLQTSVADDLQVMHYVSEAWVSLNWSFTNKIESK
jgi:hypothetical protein